MIDVRTTGSAFGVAASSRAEESRIVNRGDVNAISATGESFALHNSWVDERDSRVITINDGDLIADSGINDNTTGIRSYSRSYDGQISIVNAGGIAVTAGNDGFGIDDLSALPGSLISIVNAGDIWLPPTITVTAYAPMPGVTA